MSNKWLIDLPDEEKPTLAIDAESSLVEELRSHVKEVNKQIRFLEVHISQQKTHYHRHLNSGPGDSLGNSASQQLGFAQTRTKRPGLRGNKPLTDSRAFE